MNQNVSRQKLVIGGVASVALILAGITFMGQWNQRSAETPEAAVEAIYQRCRAGTYDATAGYYLGGPATDAEMRIAVCLKITQSKSIKGWEIVSHATAEDDAVIMTRNLREGGDGRFLKWTLVRKGGRWLVAEVV